MSIESIEASEQDNSARELIDISYGTTIHRITTATRDILYGGQLYKATAAARSECAVANVDDDDLALELTLPVNHAFVKRYVLQFVPPLRISVQVRKLYESGDIETVWLGFITSMSVDDDNTEARFRVPSRGNDEAQRLLPTLSNGRLCPYILYGAGCNVVRTASVGGLAHKVLAPVLHVNGREVRVDLADTDRLGTWAVGGEIAVNDGAAQGDRMTIRGQSTYSGTHVVLTLHQQIPGLVVGDVVEVYAGCDHSIDGTDGCGPKFDNKDNYGGNLYMPADNPFWRRR